MHKKVPSAILDLLVNRYKSYSVDNLNYIINKKNYSVSCKEKKVRVSVKWINEELDIPYSVLPKWLKSFVVFNKNSFLGKSKCQQTEE